MLLEILLFGGPLDELLLEFSRGLGPLERRLYLPWAIPVRKWASCQRRQHLQQRIFISLQCYLVFSLERLLGAWIFIFLVYLGAIIIYTLHPIRCIPDLEIYCTGIFYYYE
jgi:hypothetical protein